MDLNIQATSLGAASDNLRVAWSDNGFGPMSGTLTAQMTGHVVSGIGSTIQYRTYYDVNNGVWTTASTPTTALLTDSGLLATPTYASLNSSSLNQALYGLTEFVVINSSPGGAYSLDATLNGAPDGVPDGGTTVMLLGAALAGLACLRRIIA